MISHKLEVSVKFYHLGHSFSQGLDFTVYLFLLIYLLLHNGF